LTITQKCVTSVAHVRRRNKTKGCDPESSNSKSETAKMGLGGMGKDKKAEKKKAKKQESSEEESEEESEVGSSFRVECASNLSRDIPDSPRNLRGSAAERKYPRNA
jgi:hypothetical protein